LVTGHADPLAHAGRAIPLRPYGEPRNLQSRRSRLRSHADDARREALHLDDGTRVELLRDAMAVRLDRAARDEQSLPDLGVAVAADDQVEDLELALRQVRVQAAGARFELAVDHVLRNAGRQVTYAVRRIADRGHDCSRGLGLLREPGRAGAQHVG